MAPPLVIMEIVSHREIQRDRDYIAKRIQYQDCYIPEYWIIDPEIEKVSVLLLVSGFYEVTEFTGEQEIKSLLFPELKLTAKQIFDV